jgi:uncharacterized protein (TIGR01244 family)
MADIRTVTEDFAVAPQLLPAEMAEVAALGFTLVINNRPDQESPGQPSAAQVQAAAEAAGLAYVHIPVVGGASADQLEAFHAAVASARGPVLAFCRSGTRSITTWARGQAQHGDRTPGELVELGGDAGYDLSGAMR